MAQNDLPPFPNGELTDHPGPRSRSLWLALMALHHIRYDYPTREYFTGKNIDAAITVAWVEYLEVALQEGVKS